MTLPVIDLRGQGSIGESLARIGAAAANVIRPFEEERQEFNNFLATTPGAAERLAQQERLNPGFLKNTFSFLPDEQIATIVATPVTAAQTAEQIARQGLASLPKEVLRGLQAVAAAKIAGGVTPKEAVLAVPEAEAAAEIVRGDPEAIIERVREDIVGVPLDEERLRDLRAELTQQAQDVISSLPIPEQERIALRTIAPEALFDADLLLAHTRRMEVAAVGSQTNSAEATARATLARREAEGIRLFNETNVGSPEGWTEFIYAGPSALFNGQTPLARGRFLAQQNLTSEQIEAGLLDGTINQDQLAAMKLGQAMERREQGDMLADISSQGRVVKSLVDDITEVDRDGNPVLSRSVRIAMVEQLNDAYRYLNSVSGGTIPMRTAEIPEGNIFQRGLALVPFIGPPNAPLIIRDADGKELDSADPIAGAAVIPEEPTARTPEQARTVLAEARRIRGAIEESQRQTVTVAIAEGAKEIPDTMINFQQIDQALLTPNGISNIQTIIGGGGSFLELAEEKPAGALELLQAFRIKSPVVLDLIQALEARIPEEEPEQ
jgi:hypothetical protein